jgi:steroid 5-alpha reductase family enzyme
VRRWDRRGADRWPESSTLLAVTPSTTYPIGRSFVRLSKTAALLLVTGFYAVTFVGALLVALLWDGHHPLAVALFADIVATVIIFAFSMLVANSSMYDAYWSVIPPVVAIYFAAVAPSGLPTGVLIRQVLVVGLVLLWAIRLTGNWVIGWPGFDHEDWRYVDLRSKLPRGVPWPVVSFLAIQLAPTLVVFAAMLPLWPALASPSHDFGVLDVVATIVTLGAIALELAADSQMRAFTRNPANRGKPMDQGLWSWSRHPNYLGEILFWTGLWLFALASNPSWWWTVIGPLVIIGMFLGASIPMMETRSVERRPSYADYQARVAKLLPLRPPSARATQRQT